MKHSHLIAIFASLAISQSLSASSADVNSCIAQTLDHYIGSNPCIVDPNPGVLIFSNFSFSAFGTGSPTLLNSSDILVTPLAGGLGGGFQFGQNNTFSVGQGQTATYIIDYIFTIDPGPVMGSSDLGLDPPFGTVSISQSFCNDGYFLNQNTCSATRPSFIAAGNEQAFGFVPQTITVDNSNPPSSRTAHINFMPPAYSFGEIRTTIFLNGTNGPSGFDNIGSNSQVFASPEPGTEFLLFGGLFAVGMLRKCKIRV